MLIKCGAFDKNKYVPTLDLRIHKFHLYLLLDTKRFPTFLHKFSTSFHQMYIRTYFRGTLLLYLVWSFHISSVPPTDINRAFENIILSVLALCISSYNRDSFSWQAFGNIFIAFRGRKHGIYGHCVTVLKVFSIIREFMAS